VVATVMMEKLCSHNRQPDSSRRPTGQPGHAATIFTTVATSTALDYPNAPETGGAPPVAQRWLAS